MTQFITSDTHFNHKNIMRFCSSSRGHFTSVQQHDNDLIYYWNSVVKEGDDIYHLGDFCFSPAKELLKVLEQLNGNIHLILGNHDKQIRKSAYLRSKFASVQDYLEININNTRVVLFHYPIQEWNGAHHGSVHFHGHLHSKRTFGRSMDVGVDSNSLVPYNLEDLVKIMSQRLIEVEHYDR